ncbi:MAG: NFACT family protein [Anaeroplasmataceae bacterium]
MPIDGLFLKKLSNELSFLINGRINKILEVSDKDFIIQIRTNHQNYNLLISTSSEYSRIHITDKKYDYPYQPKGFTMLLRKYFEGNIISNIYTYEMDRVFVIEAFGNNEIGDLEYKKIIIELMGRYSNIIITKNDIIIDALKKQNALENERTIFPNAKFEYLESSKINPYNLSKEELTKIFNDKNIITSREITNTFMGISPLLSEYIINTNDYSESLYNIINSNIKPVIIKNKNKNDFYFNSLDKEIVKDYKSLSSMLDDHYYGLALKERIRQKTNDLSLFVHRQLDKLKSKLIKLNEDYEEALKGDLYRLYGELLIANSYNKGKYREISVLNYYNNEEITIPLDIRYNIIDNSKIYFKKYQKSKNAIEHILLQKQKTIDEIEYFAVISSQIENAGVNDILEIQQELQSLKYIEDNKNKKVKKSKTKILSYNCNDTIILIGKNNIQNEIITHKLSKPSEYWFHVKEGPGSHVLLRKSEDLTEQEIRTAANLAALYSPLKDSSSVAVNYTKIKYIKKIPGKRNCFVTYSNEKTIFIDPDMSLIKESNFKYLEN